ncbi:hypothetical protein NOK12_36810 [Nocardioides sp. OK12]|nr:hypothetical protein NOK12_36810 [Nocardioides sp. OK12]
MVQLSARILLGPAGRAAGLVTGTVALVLGVALVRRADSAFGTTWAALFLVLGLIVLVSSSGPLLDSSGPAPRPREVTWDGERATYRPRRAGRAWVASLGVLTLLGGWFAVMGTVGAVTENWLWPVLASVPAVYFLGFPVLALLGRFRVGGTWISATRVVDEHHGLRSELRLADVATAVQRGDSVRVTAAHPGAVTRHRLTPRPWRARPRSQDLEIVVDGPAAGGADLAAELTSAAAAAGRRGDRSRRRSGP